MLIGERRAVTELWEASRRRLGRPREDRLRQPVYLMTTPPEGGGTGLRPATPADLDVLVPACAKAHQEELGVDPLRRDANGFRWRTRVQIEELYNAGRRTITDLGRAQQSEYAADAQRVSAMNRLQSALDRFKITLGMPVTAQVDLDPAELDQLT